MHEPESIPAWYVLHTRSRFEAKVHDGLLKKSKTVFLPKMLTQSRRRDRKQMIRIPLFPGYVFVHTDLTPEMRLDILKTVGVVKFIGNSGGPLPVAEATIESLKIMVSANQGIHTGQQMKKGQPVIVVQGPFTGVTGHFLSYRGQHRVVVHIEALGQYAAVEVDEDDIEPAPLLSGR
ncbi:MAG: UpxY family transcription antiterminator [Pseudomonadota bacterium]